MNLTPQKLSHEEFLIEVRNLHIKARNAKFRKGKIVENVFRCTSHSISSEFEDLLAEYCSHFINTSKSSIFIDPQITFENKEFRNRSGKRGLLYRPDIIVVKNNEIVLLIDAKVDIGFNRKNFGALINEKVKLVEKIAGQMVKFKLPDKKSFSGIKISQSIKLTCFVASGRSGITQPNLDEITPAKRINIFHLSKGGHLNNYSDLKGDDNLVNVDLASMEAFDQYLLNTIGV